MYLYEGCASCDFRAEDTMTKFTKILLRTSIVQNHKGLFSSCRNFWTILVLEKNTRQIFQFCTLLPCCPFPNALWSGVGVTSCQSVQKRQQMSCFSQSSNQQFHVPGSCLTSVFVGVQEQIKGGCVCTLCQQHDACTTVHDVSKAVPRAGMEGCLFSLLTRNCSLED